MLGDGDVLGHGVAHRPTSGWCAGDAPLVVGPCMSEHEPHEVTVSVLDPLHDAACMHDKPDQAALVQPSVQVSICFHTGIACSVERKF